MINKKSIKAIQIICIVLLPSTFANMVFAEQSEENIVICNELIDDWTVMYYMCADLSFFNEDPSRTLENLTRIGSTDGLNILVMFDSFGIGDTQLILVNDTGGKEILNDLYGWPDEVDTSNTNTFISFCKLMMQEYPAKNYALFIVAPGTAGWQIRSFHDSNGARGPTWPVFADALKDITDDGANKIDVIFIESCVLGMIENAYEIAPYISYMVTSEEHIPDGEFCVKRYYKPLCDLVNNTEMNPEEFANTGPYRHEPVNFTFFEFTANPITKILDKLPFPRLHTVKFHTTCCSVNISYIDAATEAIDDLASFLVLHVKDENVHNAVKKSREQVREYGKGLSRYWPISFKLYRKFPLEMLAFTSWVDLYNLVDLIRENVDNQVIKDKCFTVLEKLDDLVISMTKVTGDESYGLSVYFPQNKYHYNSYVYGPIQKKKDLSTPYENLRFTQDTMWDEFLKHYLKIY